MLNFDFYNPVRLVFGKDSIAQLKDLVPAGAKVLMTYGGGSIKKNGVYEQVIAALKGHQVIEFPGIEPNPHDETCMKAVEIAKREGVGFLLAVGGGSVVDGTKFIAAASKYSGGDPWEILQGKSGPLKDALPLGSVITLPATGSEMNFNAVISRAETKEKLFFGDPLVYPKFSVVDPRATFTLPTRQTVNGIVDTFVHVMEQYMTYDVNSPLQDRMSESVIKTLVQEAPKVLAKPDDYEARSNLFWCSTVGLNGWLSCGVVQDWATHMIGHELTAVYGLDHGQTLAIVMPSLWRYAKESKKAKLAQFAKEVFGSKAKTQDKLADDAIAKTEAFFHSIGMKTKLADYNVKAADAAEEVKRRFASRNFKCGEKGDIDGEAAFKILSGC
jgi:NADP-dependent alcohol dehydrogenase